MHLNVPHLLTQPTNRLAIWVATSRRQRIAPAPTSEDDGTDEVPAELILGRSLRPGHNQTNILLTLLWIDEAAAALGDATVDHQEPLYTANYNRNLLTLLENFITTLISCPFESSSTIKYQTTAISRCQSSRQSEHGRCFVNTTKVAIMCRIKLSRLLFSSHSISGSRGASFSGSYLYITTSADSPTPASTSAGAHHEPSSESHDTAVEYLNATIVCFRL